MSINLDQLSIVLAILNEIDRQVPGLKVDARKINAITCAANNIVAEFKRPEISTIDGMGIEAWRKTDDVGVSSDFMAAKLGGAGVRKYGHPHDPSDFGRCLSLLRAAPELRERLPEMATHWDELEALWNKKPPKLYRRMRELLNK